MNSLSRNPKGRRRLFGPLNTDPATRFVGTPTEDLVISVELWKMDRALILAEGPNLTPVQRNGLAVLEVDLAVGIAELDRRSRAAMLSQATDDPWAPAIPKGNPALIELARELKAIWPLERACEVLFGMVLDRKAKNPKARCPLGIHSDSTPSFVIYPDGHWHCFGCSESGDLWTLVQTIQRIGFKEAVRMVADATKGVA